MPRPAFVRRRALQGAATAAILAAGIAAAPSSALAANAPAGAQVDLKVLLISAKADDVGLVAWKAQLDRDGVPYDTIIADNADGTITPERLAEGNHAKYQGIVLGKGDVTHDVGGQSVSALTDAEWAALNGYQAKFGVRRVADDTFPTAAHGFGPAATGASMNGKVGTVTAAGKTVFSDLTGSIAFDAGSFGFEAPAGTVTQRPAGSTFTSLVTGASGSTYVGILTTADGVEEMPVTFNSNVSQFQSQLLRAGELRWVTKGTHLGFEKRYFSTQVDDIFLPDDRWDATLHKTLVDGPTTADNEVTCDTNTATAAPDCKPIRMVPGDVDTLVAWQNANGVKLDMVFNGSGAVEVQENTGAVDPLLTRFLASKNEFRWINHTFTHPQLDASSQATIQSEITQNRAFAVTNGLPNDPEELVTGEHSGLHNPAMPAALDATGIKYTAADNSREPAQYGIGNAKTVPRFPSNIYYNVATKDEQLDEYNWIYSPPASNGGCVAPRTDCRKPEEGPVTWEQYTASEASIMLGHVLGNDPRPHYAHQNNLTGDGTLYLVLNVMLARYKAGVNVKLEQPSLKESGVELARRAVWAANKAKVSGYIKDGQVTITSSVATDVPLTGTDTGTLQGTERAGWRAVPASTITTPAQPAAGTNVSLTPDTASFTGTSIPTTGATSAPAPAPQGGVLGKTTKVTPLLSGVKLLPRTFTVTHPKRRKGVVDGTVISGKASAALKLKFTVERKSGKKYRSVGTFTRSVKKGRVSLRFSGKVRGKLLKVGSYRLKVVATPKTGKAQTVKALSFRVKKGR